MLTAPDPYLYPREVRDGVADVARNRDPGQHLKQIAAGLGGSESGPTNG
jgi:transposase